MWTSESAFMKQSAQQPRLDFFIFIFWNAIPQNLEATLNNKTAWV